MSGLTTLFGDNDSVVLFAVVLLEQAGLPIPAAPCLLAAGALCSTGESSPGLALGLTVLACVLADSAWFYLGRRSGNRVWQFLRWFGFTGGTASAERTLLRHNVTAVALAKFIPGLSVAAPPLAGALGMGFAQFLLFDAFGATLYGAFYLLVGSVFSEQVQSLLKILDRLGLFALLILAALTIAWIVCHSLRSKTAPRPN